MECHLRVGPGSISFLFASGHQMTITTVRWEAAYIGFHGDFDNYIIPSILILLNTFASYILGVLSMSLLLFWPRIRGHLPFLFEKAKGGRHQELSAEEKKGEFALNEDHIGLRASLFKALLGYMVFHGCKVREQMQN